MFDDDTIAGSWTALCARLDRGHTLTRWAGIEPALVGLERIEQLTALVGAGVDPDREDAVVGALVRLATVTAGADEPDAVLVVLHLLSGIVLSLRRQLRDLSPDILTVVVNELTAQIRAYGGRARTRAYVENLHRETRRAVLQEYRPWLVRRHPEYREVLLAPDNPAWAHTRLGGTVAGPDHDNDLDVADLLAWAVREGVDTGDLSLLIATERARFEYPGASQDTRTAREHGIHPATLYRRNNRTRAALRLSAGRYLTAVA